MSHSALREGLLRQLTDATSDVHEEAIRLCGEWKIPGYEPKLREIVSSGSHHDRETVLRILTHFDLSESLFNVALELPDTVARQFGQWDLIRRFLKSPVPAVGVRAYAWLKQYAEDSFQSDATGFDGGRCELIRTICNFSPPEDLMWLNDRSAKERGYCSQLFDQSAMRHDHFLCRRTILDPSAKPDQVWNAIEAAPVALARSEDSQLIDRLMAISARSYDQHLESIVTALLAIGGEHAQLAACAVAPRLSVRYRSFVYQQFSDATVEDFLIVSEEIGLVSKECRSLIAQRLGEHALKLLPQSPETLIEILRQAGLVLDLYIRLQGDQTTHDRVLPRFAWKSRGMFQPEAALETWFPLNDRESDGHYSMKFIHGNRLYVGRLRYCGRNMDIDRLVAMVNIALQDSGISQRFVGMHTDHDDLEYVYGEPRHVASLANQFQFPVSESTRRGQDDWDWTEPPASDGEPPVL